ncbi:hypothetical protein MNBD_ALPHA12-1268 [hydrothermal vent metagenome]|uniref:Uncharacterized protein n=1 Tax=hydrothermal vent metagenome TaxID=652676 RepID=A0A3B0U607_9ZZZZ
MIQLFNPPESGLLDTRIRSEGMRGDRQVYPPTPTLPHKGGGGRGIFVPYSTPPQRGEGDKGAFRL